MPASASPPRIELHGIEKTYRNGDVATTVLRGVSLAIEPGEFVAILGASGSGKSTLMNILGCLDRPSGGRYLIGGEDVAGFGPDRLAALRRDVFGFVFQQYNLLPGATAAENVEMPAVYAGLSRSARAERAHALLGRLGLAERMHHRPSQLSGGQQQRVSIARALMNGGGIILADEPTGALDSASGREVMDLLRTLNAEGHTVILITHDAEVAAEAHRRIRIADGRIVGDDGDRPGAPRPSPAAPSGGRGRGARFAGDAGEAIRMALRSMRGNAFRTLLTLLGIVIGVGAVIAMLAIGDGAKREVLSKIEAMGTDLLLVRPGGGPGVRGGSASLTFEDAAELARAPGILNAVPELGGSVTIRFGNLDYQSSATATSAEFPVARNWPVVRGTFVQPADVTDYAAVVVLGQTVAEALFPEGFDPIGKYILMKNVPFQVIGIMGEKGASPWGSDLDDVVFIPLTTGSLRVFGQRHLRSIIVQVAPGTDMAAAQETVERVLRERHGAEDFRVRNMASALETATATQNTFTVLLGSVAAISLLVGGIGVMNIMLVSVTERTREIGIRMATGARSADVQMQFLIEALVACTLGGLLGVAGGLGTSWVVQRFGTPIELSLAPVLLAFGCAAGTGLVFGYLPARKAARLDPVAALSSD
ncbi:MacB family efflux pump subunit [Arenibaculum pallidiluteum]|uniref:MacB family efflux pump subunit n=1 Tax=Arenibaculum pallidiluteum TaxID=2812559 RepID=UPI001A95C5ED|nr:MacB family efflux pump subunit [Arenibaculum pallidiluteum]